VSSSSSSSSGTSPVSPPDFVGLGVMPVAASPATYHSFLDRFCFYTGPEASGIEGLPRTQSVSSVEELLSAASASPRLHAFVQKQQQQHYASTPLRFDDTRSSGSGATTPTATAAPESSRSATPVAA